MYKFLYISIIIIIIVIIRCSYQNQFMCGLEIQSSLFILLTLCLHEVPVILLIHCLLSSMSCYFLAMNTVTILIQHKPRKFGSFPKHEFPTWYVCALYPLSLSFTSIKQKEDERLRTQLRRENQQRRMRERSQAKGLSASFLEPDRYEDEGEDLEQSLLAIKNKYKKKLAKGLLML